jgi:hypothetical protein
MKTKKNGNGSKGSSAIEGNAALAYLEPGIEEIILERFDELVAAAAAGDGRAVGAIAIALGPNLVAEARDALGRDYEQDAADVVQDVFVKLLEGTQVFPRIHGAGVAWLMRLVRMVAKAYRDRGPEGDMAG